MIVIRGERDYSIQKGRFTVFGSGGPCLDHAGCPGYDGRWEAANNSDVDYLAKRRGYTMRTYVPALALASVAVGTIAVLGGPPDATAPIDKLVESVAAANSPVDAAKAYQSLFAAVDKDGLRSLQTNPNDGVAILAAWEEVVRGLADQPAKDTEPDHDRLMWFQGFLEGRGRLRAPRWWAETLLDSRIRGRRGIDFVGPRFRKTEVESPKPAEPPPRAKVEYEDGKTIVRVGSESAVIPDDYRGQFKPQGPVEAYSALITPARCYIALHDEWGRPYTLVCVDRKSQKVIWASKVWGTFWYGGSTGRSHQWIEIVEQGDRIAVFAATRDVHVEVFRCDTGANITRFSNAYLER
jgi:hypothetical protein